MGDISIIARRLTDGHVQYGWSGNGGIFKNTGIRLLCWYDDPELVEYLFGLGELGLIGKPGSEKGGYSWAYTHDMTGYPHSLGTTEREIFSKIAFIDYGYFYDTDNRWYYIIPGPFRIKMPLEHLYQVVDENGNLPSNFYLDISKGVLQYIFTDYLVEDSAFADLLAEKQKNPGKLLNELLEKRFPIEDFWEHHRSLFSYFDDWVLAITDDEDEKIVRYIVKPKTEKHIETIDWV